MDHDCAECNGSGELCSECCAPHHWCECVQGDVAPLAVGCKTCAEKAGY